MRRIDAINESRARRNRLEMQEVTGEIPEEERIRCIVQLYEGPLRRKERAISRLRADRFESAFRFPRAQRSRLRRSGFMRPTVNLEADGK